MRAGWRPLPVGLGADPREGEDHVPVGLEEADQQEGADHVYPIALKCKESATRQYTCGEEVSCQRKINLRVPKEDMFKPYET